jgi:hypothetical protein
MSYVHYISLADCTTDVTSWNKSVTDVLTEFTNISLDHIRKLLIDNRSIMHLFFSHIFCGIVSTTLNYAELDSINTTYPVWRISPSQISQFLQTASHPTATDVMKRILLFSNQCHDNNQSNNNQYNPSTWAVSPNNIHVSIAQFECILGV